MLRRYSRQWGSALRSRFNRGIQDTTLYVGPRHFLFVIVIFTYIKHIDKPILTVL